MRPEDILARHAPHEDRSARGVVARTPRAGLRTPLATPHHSFVADEPANAGGTNEGPTPYDLLAAALAACTTMTLRLYADRKGWPLEEARAQVTHEKIHAEDCGHCETAGSKLDRLERTVELRGSLSEEQRRRLMEIADRCPVHQTLHGDIDVRTHLKETHLKEDAE